MNKIEQVISEQKRLESQDQNFRNLWQDTADYIWPNENMIVDRREPGERKYDQVYNTVAVQDAREMASGITGLFIPPGEEFFSLGHGERGLANNSKVQKWLSVASMIAHDRMFTSNFVQQVGNAFRNAIVFGTLNLFSEFNLSMMKLNYRSEPIGTYQIMTNAAGIVDTVYHKFEYTAHQAVDHFGIENVGPTVKKAWEDSKAEIDRKYWFIHAVRPRTDRDTQLRDSDNMPWESVYCAVEDKVECESGGFEEFPYAVTFWEKSSTEGWGRGQGTMVLPAVRQFQQMEVNITDCGNLWNNPPLEVLESFEGKVRVTPGAVNRVAVLGSIRAVAGDAKGNYPISIEDYKRKEEEIHRAFYKNIFSQFMDLKGDRRNQMELREKKNEAMRLIGNPALNLIAGMFSPTIKRTIMLLLRNGLIPIPPEELLTIDRVRGIATFNQDDINIEYKGELALALRDHQARGFTQYADFVRGMEEIIPGSVDNLNSDRAIQRMGRAFGVNPDDMATEEEIAAKRQARAEQVEQDKMAELAAMGAQGYKDTSQAAEDGSPAKSAMEAMSA